MLETFAESAAQQGIQLKWQDKLGPHLYSFDVAKLVQISTNLVANALKWTPPGALLR
ncbi:hypothetical protein [Spirosoma oryzicola]|uniref:hypothetical protein n=1 Tax=Spirosoma oryzicola TaxID=2898794 RepID=UPI001E367123|nr:hypothetical protein [Spirosoma oryzicola]UHG93750.1 hypothetical protein LQ777_24835 [Spirosoma oryzicola]